MGTLLKDASKKEDKVFRGVKDILALVEKMLSLHPEDRPTAQAVQERLYTILSEHSGLGPPAEGGRGTYPLRSANRGRWDGFQFRVRSVTACESKSSSGSVRECQSKGDGAHAAEFGE